MSLVYQSLVSGVELLQDLVHDGVGEIGNHRQLYFSGKLEVKNVSGIESKSISYLSNSAFHSRLTPELGERPAPLSPSGRCGLQSEGWIRARRRMRAGELISLLQKKITDRARDRGTPWSLRSPATDAGYQRLCQLRRITFRLVAVPAAPYQLLWRVHRPESPVSAALDRPRTAHEPAHTVRGTARWRRQIEFVLMDYNRAATIS